MNTVRLFHRVALAILAVFVLARPAVAQEVTEADTIWVDGDKTIVIISDEGRRMVIRSADDADGPRLFFDSDDVDGARFFNVEPGRFGYRWRAPKVLEFHGDDWGEDEDAEHITALSDYMDNLSGVWTEQFGDGIRLGIGESMREHSEVMRMEMESRRLAQRARRAEEEERTRLETELEETLQEIFDRKQALREEHIDHLREELDKVLEEHNERSQHQREIIERRMNQLLEKKNKYDW